MGPAAFSNAFERPIASLGQLPSAAGVLEDSSGAVSFIPYLRKTELPVEVSDTIR